MLIDERQNQILEIIKEKVFVRVDELAARVYASPATIRRDLALLDQAGLIQRLHGGASLIGASAGETSTLVRKQSNVVEKRRIALRALDFIQNGGCYFLDSSTTSEKIVPFLTKKNDITIITNGLETGVQLASIPSCKGYIAGGEIQRKSASSISGDVALFVSAFTCEATFFSCKGASLINGPTEGTLEQQRCKAAMLCHSSKHILLIDHTKFGQTHMVSDCPWSEVDVVITDEEPPKEFLKTFEENKVQLVIAS
ncbi:MAG: DeoR/GlpR family DNA-binding transcription regulator [Candidatus Enteromonas sp.]|nr:DeoR/GlpR family DNA-binding transcription regulator [bacterium]MDY6100780.1 DeoR/GlpR family DNA-binding transcription regulator [Candidatus Enteromonas sp.]